jgi:multiple sugar transport system ATP-binding protein
MSEEKTEVKAEEKKEAPLGVNAQPKPKKMSRSERRAADKAMKQKSKEEIDALLKRDAEDGWLAPEDAFVSLHNINKIYDNGFHAVHDFSIDIKQHEFIVFVGPSGCGKSTTLRMIAGLEDISSGTLEIDHEYMNDVAPKDRNIAMVFQSYALYPHMTVYNNIAFPLKIMKLPKAEIDRRVMEAARILQITPYLDRKPKALSGGQRQRVALGRAIVKHAKVLLMDEPLSNLDAKLRVQMRSEIVKLHNSLNATTIYVTHDQTEAMTMATRIVILKDGYIQQIGTPLDIFNHPINKFVAGFIGSPAMNFYPVLFEDGDISFVTGQKIHLPEELWKGKDIPHKATFGIRPEDMYEGRGKFAELYPDACFQSKVILAELLGNEYYVHTDFGFQDTVSKFPSDQKLAPGDKVTFSMNLAHCHLFNDEDGKAIF